MWTQANFAKERNHLLEKVNVLLAPAQDVYHMCTDEPQDLQTLLLSGSAELSVQLNQ